MRSTRMPVLASMVTGPREGVGAGVPDSLGATVELAETPSETEAVEEAVSVDEGEAVLLEVAVAERVLVGEPEAVAGMDGVPEAVRVGDVVMLLL